MMEDELDSSDFEDYKIKKEKELKEL